MCNKKRKRQVINKFPFQLQQACKCVIQKRNQANFKKTICLCFIHFCLFCSLFVNSLAHFSFTMRIVQFVVVARTIKRHYFAFYLSQDLMHCLFLLFFALELFSWKFFLFFIFVRKLREIIFERKKSSRSNKNSSQSSSK